MDTSHNHLREPDPCESSFLRAKRYLSDLSQPEKEVLLSNLGVGSGKVLVENLPDEEDLTQKMQGGHNVLKFKDKIFNPEMFSGMGKVFLRKNMAKDINRCHKPINILTQNMFEDKHGLPLVNTIFIVQYDYDLDKGFITIPENSILVFAGGSFRNGTVILRNTLILPAGLDIEHFMSVNIKGTYKEGSLVYLRKHLRLFNGENWINIGGTPDFSPQDKFELISLLKRYVNAALDIVSPFKITIIPEKNYIESGPHDIKVSWDYNRLINNQDIRLESGNKYKIYEELDKNVREYTFENIDAEDPVTIVVSTTYKGETVSEAITLTDEQNSGLIIDDELDENSKNPVTNRAITAVINSIQNTLNTFLTKEEADEIYAKKNHTHANYADKVHTHSEYATNADLLEYAKITDLDEYAKTTDLDEYAKTSDLSDYATVGDLNDKQDVLPSGSDGQVLKWNNGSWQPGTDERGIDVSGITEEELTGELKLDHDDQNIILKYKGNQISYTRDVTGDSGSGDLNASDISYQGEIDENSSVPGKYLIGTLSVKNSNYKIYGHDVYGGDTPPTPATTHWETIYTVTSNDNIPQTPENYIAESENDYIVGNQVWSHTAPNTGILWMAQRMITTDNLGLWTTPVRLSGRDGEAGLDGAIYEYVYIRTQEANESIQEELETSVHNTQPNKGKTPADDDFVPYGWNDNPEGIDEEYKYEWMSYRVKTFSTSNPEGVWSDFATPVLWSAYGKQGMDGDGVEYIFSINVESIPSSQYPETWTEDENFQTREYIRPNQVSNWKDDPLNLDNYPQGTKEYVCIRKRYADNADEEAYWHAYSSPKLWAYKAKDGVVNGFIVNLSDTTFPVGVNEEGKSETDVTIESEVEVFQNSFPYYNYEVELGNNLPQWVKSSTVTNPDTHNETFGKVSIIIDGTEIIENGEAIPVIITLYDNQQNEIASYVRNINVIAVASGLPGSTISLKCDTLTYYLSYDKNRVSPTTFSPYCQIVSGSLIDQNVINIKPEDSSDYTFKYQGFKENGDSSALFPVNNNSTTINKTYDSFIKVYLYYKGLLIDEITLAAVKQGEPGIAGYSVTNYKINIIDNTVEVNSNKTVINGHVKFTIWKYTGTATGTEAEQILNFNEVTPYSEIGGTAVSPITLSAGRFQITVTNVPISSSTPLYSYIALQETNYQTNPAPTLDSVVIPFIQEGKVSTQGLDGALIRFKNYQDIYAAYMEASSSEKDAYDYRFGNGIWPDTNGIKYIDVVVMPDNSYFKVADEYTTNKDDCKLSVLGLPGGLVDNGGIYSGTEIYYGGGRVPEIYRNHTLLPFSEEDGSAWELFTPSGNAAFDTMLAKSAYIANLTSKQVIVVDDEFNPVAGMVSGAASSVDPIPETDNFTNEHGIRIFAGKLDNSGDIQSAPFTVDESGILKADMATINGQVTSDKLTAGDSNLGSAVISNLTANNSDITVNSLKTIDNQSNLYEGITYNSNNNFQNSDLVINNINIVNGIIVGLTLSKYTGGTPSNPQGDSSTPVNIVTKTISWDYTTGVGTININNQTIPVVQILIELVWKPSLNDPNIEGDKPIRQTGDYYSFSIANLSSQYTVNIGINDPSPTGGNLPYTVNVPPSTNISSGIYERESAPTLAQIGLAGTVTVIE